MACAFLIEKTAKRLHCVQTALEKKGLGLKIYDGYRPLSIQNIFWDLVPDSCYVAVPAKARSTTEERLSMYLWSIGWGKIFHAHSLR